MQAIFPRKERDMDCSKKACIMSPVSAAMTFSSSSEKFSSDSYSRSYQDVGARSNQHSFVHKRNEDEEKHDDEEQRQMTVLLFWLWRG